MTDLISIDDFCDRYKISRRTFDRRVIKLKELGARVELETIKCKNYLTPSSFEVCRQAHEHLQTNGATLNNFVRASETTVDEPKTSELVPQHQNNLLTEDTIATIIYAVQQAIVLAAKQPPSLTPVDKKLDLVKAAQSQIILTSADVKFYTGKQPVSCRTDSNGDRFYPYGNFRFYKVSDRFTNGSGWLPVNDTISTAELSAANLNA